MAGSINVKSVRYRSRNLDGSGCSGTGPVDVDPGSLTWTTYSMARVSLVMPITGALMLIKGWDEGGVSEDQRHSRRAPRACP